MNPSEIDSMLAGHPLFEGLRPEYLALIRKGMRERTFEEDTDIFREGEPANVFYLILEGTVILDSELENGQTLTVQTLKKGNLLGWSWLFEPYEWEFTATAIEKVTAVEFNGKAMRERCEQDRELGYTLMKRYANLILKRLQSFRSQTARIAAELVDDIYGENDDSSRNYRRQSSRDGEQW